MLRVLYVEDTMTVYGGMERELTDKIRWLTEHGDCQVFLLTVNQGSHPLVFPLPPKLEYADLDMQLHSKYRYGGLRRLREELYLRRLFRRRLREVFNRWQPDVIVCTRLDFVSAVLHAKGRVPLVFESHNSCLAWRFERYNWLQRLRFRYYTYLLKRSQMVVALTDGDAVEWCKRVPHVKVIPNIVEGNTTGCFSSHTQQSAIFVGRYTYQKDVDSLLRIWRQVHQRHPDWQLHIYGDYGQYMHLLMADAASLNANVTVHLPTTAIFDAYLQSSLLLLTSRFEPFGLVLPEAMSCALPVVAFDCPYGPSEIISDGVDGFLVPQGNEEAYISCVSKLIEHPELRIKMGQEGVRSAKRYAADAIMPHWITLFRSLKYKNC
jgi:glycosyltransferase involved in cell wall biosynthesis